MHAWACFFFSPQDEDAVYASYTIDDPQTCIAYEFQVRCACVNSLKSDWSAIHRIKGIETGASMLWLG